jgi:hypothetical protein
MSRRTFLQHSGIGLGLGWAGAALVGQISLSAAAQLSDLPQGSEFIYGTHFYHPQSGPRPDQFREMIAAIAGHYQFNLIRIFANWDYYNPRPHEYRFEEIQELLNVCDEFGVRVLMTTVLENAPYWLEQVHPEARFVNARGEAIHLGGSGAHYTGGVPRALL